MRHGNGYVVTSWPGAFGDVEFDEDSRGSWMDGWRLALCATSVLQHVLFTYPVYPKEIT